VLPDEVVRLASLHRLRQQQLARLAAAEMAKVWARLDQGDIAGSWANIAGPSALNLVIQAQTEAARGAQEYVATAVGLQGEAPSPAGMVNGSAFAGFASDGRALDGLLGYPLFEVQAFVDGGMPVADALGIGLRHLTRITATQVQDAARISTGVAQVNDRRVQGYLRQLSPPACSRCVILAGRWYRYNAGFQRHPHCDCVGVPATKDVQPQSPKALFDAMSHDELRKAGWTEADIKAIGEGADIYQVTNAHRALRSVQVAGRPVQTTLSGATRRAPGGKVIRLTPEAIYAEADRLGWSRDEIIGALKTHGYII
jgi:hypothetical protein